MTTSWGRVAVWTSTTVASASASVKDGEALRAQEHSAQTNQRVMCRRGSARPARAVQGSRLRVAEASSSESLGAARVQRGTRDCSILVQRLDEFEAPRCHL